MKNIDKEKAVDKLKELIDQWENNPERLKNGYNYEKTFVETMRELEKFIFQQSMGEIPRDKNLKKK